MRASENKTEETSPCKKKHWIEILTV